MASVSKYINPQWRLIGAMLFVIALLYPVITSLFPETRIRLTVIVFILIVLALLIWLFSDVVREKVTNPFFAKLSKSTPAWKWLASTYTGIAAVILLFFQKEIRDYSKYGFEYIGYILEINEDVNVAEYKFNFWVSLYWVFLIIWIIAYIIFVVLEARSSRVNSEKNEKLFADLKSTLLGAPDPEVFKRYVVVYKDVYDLFVYLKWKSNQVALSISDYNDVFRKVLEKIANLTHAFTGSKQGVVYGANIMIYIPNTPQLSDFIQMLRNDQAKWIHYKAIHDITLFSGVLHGVPYLKVEDHRITEDVQAEDKRRVIFKRTVPSVNLPILKPEAGHKTIPGACAAATQDLKNQFVMVDVLKVDDYFSNLYPEQRLESLNFFTGEGKGIRSFFSIRIPDPNTPENISPESFTGVLNVDCSEEFLLGKDPEYYDTYLSFLRPISSLFAPFMHEYLRLLIAETKQNI